MVAVSPPCGSPIEGSTKAMKNVAPWPIWTLAKPSLASSVARTVATPESVPGKSTAWAVPLVSWSVVVLVPVDEPKAPSVVERVIGVRFAGGWPLSARTTRTVIVLDWPEPMASCPGLAVTVTLNVTEVGGGTGGTGSTLGSDGDFDVQPA